MPALPAGLDGHLELERHLAGARFCFDVALIISAAIAIQLLVELGRRVRQAGHRVRNPG